MNIEKKWIYGGLAAFFLIIISIPSALFLESCKTYFGFLNTWSTGVLRPSRISIIPLPRTNIKSVSAIAAPQVKFIKFSLHKNAKSVKVAGNFNRWNSALFPLKKQKDIWEGSLPLPKGKYYYLFDTDGELIPDPANHAKSELNGRIVSVLEVK